MTLPLTNVMDKVIPIFYEAAPNTGGAGGVAPSVGDTVPPTPFQN